MINSKLLRELRAKRRESRREVAIAVGITEETLKQLETNPDANPTSRVIEGLATYYIRTAGEIIGTEKVAK